MRTEDYNKKQSFVAKIQNLFRRIFGINTQTNPRQDSVGAKLNQKIAEPRDNAEEHGLLGRKSLVLYVADTVSVNEQGLFWIHNISGREAMNSIVISQCKQEVKGFDIDKRIKVNYIEITTERQKEAAGLAEEREPVEHELYSASPTQAKSRLLDKTVREYEQMPKHHSFFYRYNIFRVAVGLFNLFISSIAFLSTGPGSIPGWTELAILAASLAFNSNAKVKLQSILLAIRELVRLLALGYSSFY